MSKRPQAQAQSQSQSQPPSQASGDDEASFLEAYRPRQGTHDEMFEQGGAPLPHCAGFAEALAKLGSAELTRRWQQIARQLHENGVTYNVYSDGRGADRPWQLDPIPLLIKADEWRTLERGLAQRAHLINLVLQDIYGPQSLLRQRILPPEIILANPGFLRPCHDLLASGDRFLHLYAADAARGPDGRWWVINDRTEAPSGAGYALENRVLLSRALPGLYRDSRVERLAPFFQRMLENLNRLSPRARERPHVVLLTPGPYNETYFEHAYLARYLGISLVEGGDLTVRDECVYLKTLGGLERVDVILRRLDAAFCDPLSLRPNSFIGIAGLVSAVGAGNVAIVNALGSGAVECAAMLPFLPGLCRHFLAEELLLPTAATWWCGQPNALAYVEAHLDELVVKPAFPGARYDEPVFGAALRGKERKAFLERLRARPLDFVGQQQLTLSTAPTWQGEYLAPRPLALRTHMVSDGPSYVAMPGGLTRISHDIDYPIVSMHRGGGSKDAWVLADAPVRPVSLLNSEVDPLQLSRHGGDLPSRAADNLYWLGRYLERSEGTVRLARSLLTRLTDDTTAADAPELPALLHALAIHTELDIDLKFEATESGMSKLERDLIGVLGDAETGNSLVATLASARRAAMTVRDRISGDTWRVISQLMADHDRLQGSGVRDLGDAVELLDKLIITLAAFAGLEAESLSRTYGYSFVHMGRRLERAHNTAKLLWSMLTGARADERTVLNAVLETLDNAITYRRRYQGVLQVAPVLDLVLMDETNPRAIAFQLAEISDHVARLPRSDERNFRTPAERLTLELLTTLRLANVETLCEKDDGGRPALAAHLRALIDRLPELSDSLTQGYLSHTLTMRALSGGKR